MPELPEVETVKETLKRKVLNKTIKDVRVIYPNIIENMDANNFINKIKNQTIIDITRRGKWLIFHLNDYYLLSHLRMEGKYFLKDSSEEITKHQHIIFDFNDQTSLRYNDTRKFGRMHLVEKDKLEECKPIQELGLEPWDSKLNYVYLKNKYKSKRLPIKTVILDQSIITGIGNIYADEILFLSNINPKIEGNKLTNKNLQDIIDNTRKVLEKAISLGGTTIHTYTAVDGITGRFQQKLLVHGKKDELCPNCKTKIIKIVVNTRGTYYCPNCQK